MLNRETMLSLFESALQLAIFNLDFIPEDKWDWKPAPEANSASGIVNHLGGYLNSVTRSLDAETGDFSPATTRDEGKAALTVVGRQFIDAAREASEEVLNELFHEDMPLTKGWMVSGGIIDTIYHFGQITYIQTLLGDTEIHFDPANIPDFMIG